MKLLLACLLSLIAGTVLGGYIGATLVLAGTEGVAAAVIECNHDPSACGFEDDTILSPEEQLIPA